VITESAAWPIIDSRPFGLFDYRHGHNYVLIRGFPDEADEDDDDPTGSAGDVTTPTLRSGVLDLVFLRIERIACRRSFSHLWLRYATPADQAVLESRLGRWRPTSKVYLLEPDSIESYVVAPQLLAAEFDIAGGAPSPLVSEDEDYIAAHPPKGVIRRY
jgi:hypothetical protein